MLSENEYTRIREASIIASKVPFIDDIEDFVWESIWAYSQELPNPSQKRSKLLFDVVDERKKIGWSAKTLSWSDKSNYCEFVIQRADVIDKREKLGFPDLSLEDSTPQQIGNAILAHWKIKIKGDMVKQNVVTPRVALLIKSKDGKNFYPYERPLHLPKQNEIIWQWANGSRKSLHGLNKEGKIVFKWYKNQKQLFEIFNLEPRPKPINLDRLPLTVEKIIKLLQ